MQFLSWWLRFTLPTSLPDTTPEERQKRYHSRMISHFGLLEVALFLFTFPLALLNPTDHIMFAAVLSFAFLNVIAVLFNRFGWLLFSGLVLILGIFAIMVATIVVNPLDVPQLVMLASFVIPIILSGAVLPPLAIPLMGLLSASLSCACLLVLPRAPVLANTNILTLMIVLTILHVISSISTFVIIRAILSATARADRAEEIVRLKDTIAAYEHLQLEQKAVLETGIEHLAEVLAQIARGNFAVRADLSSEHVLWQIAGPLNILLNRANTWRRESLLLQQTQQAAEKTATSLRNSVTQKRFLPCEMTGTAVDPVLVEVNKLFASLNPPQRSVW